MKRFKKTLSAVLAVAMILQMSFTPVLAQEISTDPAKDVTDVVEQPEEVKDNTEDQIQEVEPEEGDTSTDEKKDESVLPIEENKSEESDTKVSQPEMFSMQRGITEGMTCYVSATGSDTWDGINENTPFKTIQKAVDTIGSTNNCTIQLLSDIESSTSQVRTAITLTLDLNGCKMTGAAAGYTFGGSFKKLIVKDNQTGGILENIRDTGAAINTPHNGTVVISGGTVSATGISGNAIKNAGNNGIVNVAGGTVIALGEKGNAIKNESQQYNASNQKIQITGGTVKATGVEGKAIYNYRLASDYLAYGAAITITGGLIEATGTTGIAIDNFSSGAIRIQGGVVKAIHKAISDVYIDRVMAFDSGIIMGDCTYGNKVSDKGWSAKGQVTLPVDAEIPAGKTFIVFDSTTLNIAENVTLTNSGTIVVRGTLNSDAAGYGKIVGDGTVQIER